MTTIALKQVHASPSRDAKRALAVLTAINFMCLYDRVQVSALIQPIKTEFGFSDAQMGLISGTAFGLTYAAAAIPLGWLSDRTNRIKLLAVALSVWSVMTGLTAFASSFLQFALCRVGVAAGESAFTPSAHSILADYFPPERRGLAIGIETSGAALGIMSGLAMAGWIASAYGWRAALLAACVPGVVLALYMVFAIPDPPRGHLADGSVAAKGPLLSKVTGAYIWLVAAAVCSSIMTTGWTQWLPAFFMRSYGLSLGTVGASVGVAAGVGGLIGVILGGYLSAFAAARSAKPPFGWCAAIIAATAPGYALALWAPTATIALVSVFIVHVGALMMPPFIFSAIQSSCDPHFRARAGAVALTAVTIFS